MLEMASSLKYPPKFKAAKHLVGEVLQGSKLVEIGNFADTFSILGEVKSSFINPVSAEDEFANLDLHVEYEVKTLKYGQTSSKEIQTKNLRVLSGMGNIRWTQRMIEKIWDGDYPSTIAIDFESQEVYLVYLRWEKLELRFFGKLTENEVEAVEYDLNNREPFLINIDQEAMFRYIDGGEGVNHLLRNLYIELNGIVPIRVNVDFNND